MKKIIIFSDGTGNSASSPQKTNVWRAYKALDLSPGSGQIAYYDNGVGTSAFTPTAILGKAFGWGLARNVRDIYGFLCRTYEEDDEIYAFGFSRGAFTIRVTLAMIACQGVIDHRRARDEIELNYWIACAWRQFRKASFTPSMLSFFLRPLRDFLLEGVQRMRGLRSYKPQHNINYPLRNHDGKDDFIIKFVGVWDTVDAYGLPLDELTRAWDMVVWPLTVKNRDISDRIEWARHALALDEQRESFEPMLWNENNRPAADTIDDERLSQVWFPGVHANVGGGYPDDVQAFTSLNWILDESEKHDGLRYVEAERDQYQVNINAPINDNRGGAGNAYRYAPRQLEWLNQAVKPGLANWIKCKLRLNEKLHDRDRLEDWVEKANLLDINLNSVNIRQSKIHHSVFERIAHSGDAYAPINIPADYVLVDEQNRMHDIQAEPPEQLQHQNRHETAQQAAQRRVRQSYVWNKVWARTLLYYVTVIAVLWFVFYPYTADIDAPGNWLSDFLEPYIGTLSIAIRAIPALMGSIPGLGFAKNWAILYGNFPFIFVFGLIGIGFLLRVSAMFKAKINSEMSANWRHVSSGIEAPEIPVSNGRKKLAAFLGGDIFRKKIVWSLRVLIETIAVIMFVALLAAVASRLVFTTLDGTGRVCAEAPADKAKKFGTAFAFDPQTLCFATGLQMLEGARYLVQIHIEDADAWKDEDIVADLNGWRSAPWYMNLFTPVRRHLVVDWYQPVARIGNRLFDNYPLAGESNVSLTEKQDVRTDLSMILRARQSGELFIYLNDAVWFTRGGSQRFYDNNRGRAKVTVSKIPG